MDIIGKLFSNKGVNMEGFKIKQIPKAKSKLILGKERTVVVEVDIKFNKLQKKMWKFLLNINIGDIKE